MGMAQRMGLMPNRIYLPMSHLSLNTVLFYVKLPFPPPVKTSFEERIRLETHSYDCGNGKKGFTFQGYLHLNKALSLWRKGYSNGGRDV